jgi:hypothetical protein
VICSHHELGVTTWISWTVQHQDYSKDNLLGVFVAGLLPALVFSWRFTACKSMHQGFVASNKAKRDMHVSWMSHQRLAVWVGVFSFLILRRYHLSFTQSRPSTHNDHDTTTSTLGTTSSRSYQSTSTAPLTLLTTHPVDPRSLRAFTLPSCPQIQPRHPL